MGSVNPVNLVGHDLPPTEPAQGRKKIKRTMLKCDYCRQRKIKCKPENRDPGQRCQNCLEHDLSCGPNLRHGDNSPGPVPTAGTFQPFASTPIQATNATNVHATFIGPPQQLVPCHDNFLLPSPTFSRKRAFDPATPASVSSSHNSILSFGGKGSSASFPTAQSSGQEAFARVEPIQSNLTLCGHSRELFLYLQKRRRAVARLRNKIGQSYPYKEVDDGINNATRNARTQFDHDTKWAYDLIQRDPDHPLKELYLVKLGKILETFIDSAKRLALPGDKLSSHIRDRLISVIDELIGISTHDGDYAEVHRLLELRRYHLPSSNDKIREEAVAELLDSQTLSKLLQNFELDDPYSQELESRKGNHVPPISAALLRNRPDLARHLLLSGLGKLKDTDCLGRDILLVVAEIGDHNLLDDDLLRGSWPDLVDNRDSFQLTALCIAACHGYFELFKKLVEASSYPDVMAGTRDGQGRPVLYIASGAGHLAIVDYILGLGIDPNDETIDSGSGPALYAAAAAGHEDICLRLLSGGARKDVRSKSRAYKTPAEVARENGHEWVATIIEVAPANIGSHARLSSASPSQLGVSQTTGGTSFPPQNDVSGDTFGDSFGDFEEYIPLTGVNLISTSDFSRSLPP